MYFEQSLFESVLGSYFSTPAADCGFRTYICVNFFIVSDAAPAFVSTVKLSNPSVTDNSALRNTYHSHALSRTFEAELAVIMSIKMVDNFFYFSISVSFSVARK